jgi:phosphoglycolate phosphatase-like HAD superfamily hydrolase
VDVLALFDIDGTLVDAAGAGRDAIEIALIEVFGTAGPIDELPFAGLTDPFIARTLMRHAGFSNPEIDAGLPALWTSYAVRLEAILEDRRAQARVHPGVHDLLSALESLGTAIGLVTGNIARGARHKLEACGIEDRFPFGSFGSDAENRDELPQIAIRRATESTGREYEDDRIWIIGDTPRDIGCARAAGIRVLAVATGSFTRAELEEAGADIALETLADTERVLSVLRDESRGASEHARFAR